MRTGPLASLSWRKSSRSNPNNRAELAWPIAAVALRDSKYVNGPTLVVDRTALAGFVCWVSTRAPS